MISFFLTWIRLKVWQRRRKLFRYIDGQKIRRADPIEVAIALHRHPDFLPTYGHLFPDDAANAIQTLSPLLGDQ